jgi:hypothetical protein
MASIMFTSGRKSPIFGNIPNTTASDAPARGCDQLPVEADSVWAEAERRMGRGDGRAEGPLFYARRRQFVSLNVSLRKTKAPTIFAKPLI